MLTKNGLAILFPLSKGTVNASVCQYLPLRECDKYMFQDGNNLDSTASSDTHALFLTILTSRSGMLADCQLPV
jgi:hypothetical protein